MTWKGYGLVVRHGVTSWDSVPRGPRVEGEQQPSDRVTGWLDLPLRHEGIDEVMQTGQRLAHFQLDLIASSPLSRAMQTAKAIQRFQAKPIQILPVPALRAWNTGIFSGQLAKDVQSQLDYAVTHPQVPIPNGESFAQFVQRLLPASRQLIQDPRLICIVTHGMDMDVIRQDTEKGTIHFMEYGGKHAAKAGEAVFITPTGVEEIAA